MTAERKDAPREKRAWGPLASFRRRLSQNDVLSGFDREARRDGEIRTFFASTIVAALITWDIAFDLGAFHHVFFERRHQLLVVTIVVVLGAIAVRREAHIGWWIVGLLAVPMAWVGFKIVVSRPGRSDVSSVVDTGFLVVTLLILPVTFWVLLRLLVPDYFAMPNNRLKVASVIIVILVAAIGYTMGELNNHFLTCQDFQVSGNDLPDDCAGDR